jgi:ankyrin repeat protein
MLSDEQKALRIVGPMTEQDRTQFLEFFAISGISADNEPAVLDFYRNYRHHLTPGETISEAQRIFANATGMDGATLIARAIGFEKFHLIPVLLACGAEVMKPIPFTWIDTHAEKNALALAIACGAPREMLELLIKAAQKECAPSGKNCMAIQSGGTTPLFTAALEGNATCIPLLLAAGADIEEVDAISGDTPLIRAARMGSAAACEALIAAGANVNAQNKKDFSSLCYAVDGRKFQIAKLLLDHNAQWDSGSLRALTWSAQTAKAFAEMSSLPFNTLLQIAGSNPMVDLEVITFLVDNGGDVNIPDALGRTALHNAASNDRRDLIIPLLKLGADINRTTAAGDTALSLALRFRRRNMATLLIENNAVLRFQDIAALERTFPPPPPNSFTS